MPELFAEDPQVSHRSRSYLSELEAGADLLTLLRFADASVASIQPQKLVEALGIAGPSTLVRRLKRTSAGASTATR